MLFYILVYLPIICFAVLGLRYHTHMLQLSSYQFQGYFRHLRTDIVRCIAHISFILLFVLTMAGEGVNRGIRLIAMVLLFAVYIGLIISYIPKQAKKKFVVTDRVKRLFVTYVIISALMLVLPMMIYSFGLRKEGQDLGTAFMSMALAVILFVLYIGLLPLIPALANLINKPIENRINRWFIDDAVRMINEHGNLRIIGITGSFGKTSVKYYLTTLLSEGFNVLMTPESYNTPMGIVRTIREHLKPTHEIFVCEMGARHLHDIKEITDIVHPDDGIVTSIGYQHLETFHSLENIISTKYELLDAVDEKEKQQGKEPGKHLKFVNGDNEIIRANMKYQDAITYGLNDGNDYQAKDIQVTGAGTSFTVTTPSGENAEFTTKLVGRHNVENIVGAIAAAHSLGVPFNKLKMAVRRLASVPHRLELVKHGNVSILDDAYNSNPNGAKVALETLSLFEDSVKILVTPGMVELGEKEAEYNEEFGRQAAAVCDYIILVGQKNSADIERGALSAGFNKDNIFTKASFNEASELMYQIDAGKEKVILLENDLPDNYK
ncbi:UDP-N-acetylmuramoyl-tripeptide--D-alanyl-D-alanine ligase [Butyrivibrio sp. CB08]|uniref:Mur ligase family protein n=1 Tax=Butyrivibrio sp. CB08 TaxID=2364879 RepID=UPI000EA95C5C|nr:UDP-N-acetylmuramoyl-tripeptide--D-alanyl-D-alanine ligase [Butyrivibrio sp. CB08]RKM58723.1 UDP-N-acetylmuramoyl-tripeptide--D-alanyl-D-alanine ligase [Butyrivibrio sp. CB08]